VTKSRKRTVLVAGIVIVAAYSAWWYSTARALNRNIAKWIATEQAKGATIAPSAVSVRGFPAAFSLKLENPDLRWPTGFGFKAQTVKVRTHPWSSGKFKVAITGGFDFSLPPGTERPALTVAGETIRGTATFYDTALPIEWAVKADVVSVSQTAAMQREVTVASVSFDGSRPRIPPTADTDPGLTVSLRLQDLSAASIEGNPLGSTVSEVALDAKMMGALPVTADAAGLKAWRDAGGNLDITNLGLHWGPLALAANGTTAFDPQMQPEGAYTAHLSGFDPAIDALVGAGWIKMSAGSLGKLALGITARPDAKGAPTVDTPITIQDRRISVGPLKLGTVPELKLD
jgi:hypothetical protein